MFGTVQRTPGSVNVIARLPELLYIYAWSYTCIGGVSGIDDGVFG
jgi:hypothetical protein